MQHWVGSAGKQPLQGEYQVLAGLLLIQLTAHILEADTDAARRAW